MAATAKSATIRAGSLILDPKNTRIPADRRSEDQRHLIEYLIEHEDVRGLAASIAKLGLFPNERLVVVQVGRRYIVLEGNRRVAAIKLLLNPELAPNETTIRYFRRLSEKTDLGALGKLDAAVVSSRIAAAPIIAALHTGQAKKRWSSLQQARFYRELVDEGQSPAEVADELGVPLGQVNSYLRSEKLHRIALTLEYPAEMRAKIEDAKFPLTTLERFLESKQGRRLLGIELDDDQGFRGVVHPERFKAVLSRVAEDIATQPGLTRKVNSEDGFKDYIREVEPKLPKTRQRGQFTSNDLLNGESAAVAPEEEEKQKKPKRSQKPSSSVVPRGFPCTTKHERVRQIFGELKSISITDQRNSTGVMLRVLIDIALWTFFKDQGKVDDVIAHYDDNGRKRKYNQNWTPSLRELISYAVDHQLFPEMTPDGYKAVRSLASKDASYIITIDGFNEFTHNPSVTPTEGDLRALWQRAEPMLKVILN